MEQAQRRVAGVGPVSALAMAVGATVCLGIGDAIGVRDDSAEGIFMLTWLLGWAFLVWTVIVGAGCVVLCVRRLMSRRSVSRVDIALVALSFALVTYVLVTHPLWGTGSSMGA